MEKQKIIKIEVTAYKDQHGNQTCAADFRDGKVCKFYRTQRFGCNETCLFADNTGKYSGILERRKLDDGSRMGTLIPGEWCPIWNKKTGRNIDG